jgi:hypothetical protein
MYQVYMAYECRGILSVATDQCRGGRGLRYPGQPETLTVVFKQLRDADLEHELANQ